MTEQEIRKTSVFDVFSQQQETFEEAQRKNNEESRKRTQYLRFKQDGTYSIRVLPLAPIINANGEVLPMERKGYEYSLRSLILKIEDNAKSGKSKIQYVSVSNARQTFKDLKEDLIDAYVRIVRDKYSDDEALTKKLTGGSFEGGLRWDHHRCMYVLDMDDRKKGIQLLQLSYAQYRDLEERKLNTWGKLLKKNPKQGCPISSVLGAYPVEVSRKTEGKTSYSFSVDTLSDTDDLKEEEVQALLDAPRIPDVIYRYTRYHLEATLVYLRQLDEKYNIQVVDDANFIECIDTVRMLIPSDDTSHFTMDSKNKNNEKNTIESVADQLDKLWTRLENLEESGQDDKSEEGVELRTDIRIFIEENDLDVRISRSSTNRQILSEIDAELTKKEPTTSSQPKGTDWEGQDANFADTDLKEDENDNTQEIAPRQESSEAERRVDRPRRRR